MLAVDIYVLMSTSGEIYFQKSYALINSILYKVSDSISPINEWYMKPWNEDDYN